MTFPDTGFHIEHVGMGAWCILPNAREKRPLPLAYRELYLSRRAAIVALAAFLESLPGDTLLFYLSFADSTRPVGTQWLGGCFVEAKSLVGAIEEARRLGCNPGGEVMSLEVPLLERAHLKPGCYGVLLDEKQLRESSVDGDSKLVNTKGEEI